MDIDKFINKAIKRLKLYSMVYMLLDFIPIFLILTLIGVVFNLGSVLLFIGPLSPYVGYYPSFFPYIKYENLALISISFLITIPIVISIRLASKKLKNKSKSKKAIDLIEHKYPELSEKLKTAYDTANNCKSNPNGSSKEDEKYSECNVIQRDLIKEVSKEIENVKMSNLFHKKRSLAKTTLSLFVAVFLVTALFTGIHAPVTPEHFIETYRDITSDQKDKAIYPESNPDENNEKIVTENKPPTISMQPGKKIDVTIPPGYGTSHGNETDSAESKKFTVSKKYPPEALASESYDESIPDGYKEMIQNYFEKNAEIS